MPYRRGGAGDRLFVPTDQLDQVSQYVGGDTPTLSKMGGSDWAQTKSKARRATREIAKELIQLYSARMATTGHAFDADTPWQAELEEAFPHMETPDQLTTVEEVKQDIIKKCSEGYYKSFGDYKVERIDDLDGFKFRLGNDRWVMIRPSGTEAVLRIYAQAENAEEVRKVLDATQIEIGIGKVS